MAGKSQYVNIYTCMPSYNRVIMGAKLHSQSRVSIVSRNVAKASFVISRVTLTFRAKIKV